MSDASKGVAVYLECDDAAAVPHPHPMAEGQAQGPA